MQVGHCMACTGVQMPVIKKECSNAGCLHLHYHPVVYPGRIRLIAQVYEDVDRHMPGGDVQSLLRHTTIQLNSMRMVPCRTGGN